jgi:catechol 2,3-dioxygenase-like lactoylglutathione lyase family enzyme
MGVAELFTTGYVVPDLEAALDRARRSLGLTFTDVQTSELTLRLDGDRLETIPLQFAYSIGIPPHVEFIQAVPGTYYDASNGGYAHHVGLWADDLAATSDELSADGFALEAVGVGEGIEPYVFAFHLDPSGLRVELVDTVMRETFSGWLGGADLAL